jgi:hypothetical protein
MARRGAYFRLYDAQARRADAEAGLDGGEAASA